MSFRRFQSKRDGQQAAKPVYCCEACRAKHDAPMVAQCSGRGCNYQGEAMRSTPGKKRDNTCPNCARPKLKNKRIPPLRCEKCGHHEFIYFHSTGEFETFARLANLQDYGHIADLQLQVPFYLVKRKGKDPLPRKYIADFTFHDVLPDGSKGQRRIVDHKGSKDAIDPVAKLKMDIVQYMYDVTIEVVT